MNFEQLLVGDTKLIDLRSPREFEAGAFPNSISLPLLDNEQRKQIGTCYKIQGRQSAIDLGHQLISGKVKQQRISEWHNALAQYPGSYLYCWRGGLRSQIVQTWLAATGARVPIVEGGYKALRTYCLDHFAHLPTNQEIIIIAGRTGSGKTPFINKFPFSVDLEKLANHRGSAFGRHDSEQPTTINFEHALSRQLLQLRSSKTLIVEDESRVIGRLAVPEPLFQRMQKAPVIVLESSLAERSQRIFQEYVVDSLKLPGIGTEQLEARYNASLLRIKRRLGGLRCQDVIDNLTQAFAEPPDTPAYATVHKQWIEKLLNWYYDPMYDYQLSRKQPRVILSGDYATIDNYLKQQGLGGD